MKQFFATVGVIILIVAVIVGAIAFAFGAEWLGIAWKGYFNPKHEDVRRETFKRTRSYNEGKEQELIKLRLEYIREKDETSKKAIASTIRLAFADYDEKLLESAELRSFLKEIKYGSSY